MPKLPNPHKHSCAEYMWNICPPVKVVDGWWDSDYGQQKPCSCGLVFEYRRRTVWFVVSRWLTLRHGSYVPAQFGDVWVAVGRKPDAQTGESVEELAEAGA